MPTIISLFIKYLPYLITASKSVPEIITFIKSIGDIFKRTQTWTPEQEKAFDDSVEALKDDPAWKPENGG